MSLATVNPLLLLAKIDPTSRALGRVPLDIRNLARDRIPSAELASRRCKAGLCFRDDAKRRSELPFRARRLRHPDSDEVVRQRARWPTAPAVRVRNVRRVVGVPARAAVAPRPVGQVALDDGAASAVGVVQVPAPGVAHEADGAVGSSGGEVRFELDAGDEGGDVARELWRGGTDGRPILGELRGDGGCGGAAGWRDAEGEGVAIGVLGVEGLVHVAVDEGAFLVVPEILEDVGAQLLGAREPCRGKVCAIGRIWRCPLGERCACDECPIEDHVRTAAVVGGDDTRPIARLADIEESIGLDKAVDVVHSPLITCPVMVEELLVAAEEDVVVRANHDPHVISCGNFELMYKTSPTSNVR